MGLELSDDDARYFKNDKVFRESKVLKLLREANDEKSFGGKRNEVDRQVDPKVGHDK